MSPQSDDAETLAPPGFAADLRERTKSVHREAERAGFVADLIRGRATARGYAIFLRNLVPVYAALERALATAAVPPAFADPRLQRLTALRADLVAIAGPTWDASLPLLPEATAYAEAIAEATDDPLVAHAYARYLGDLSGGQILKPILARTLGLDADALAFYDFPAIADLDAPKRAMRAALDAYEVAHPAAETVVATAIAAFRHNIALSEAVRVAAGS